MANNNVNHGQQINPNDEIFLQVAATLARMADPNNLQQQLDAERARNNSLEARKLALEIIFEGSSSFFKEEILALQAQKEQLEIDHENVVLDAEVVEEENINLRQWVIDRDREIEGLQQQVVDHVAVYEELGRLSRLWLAQKREIENLEQRNAAGILETARLREELAVRYRTIQEERDLRAAEERTHTATKKKLLAKQKKWKNLRRKNRKSRDERKWTIRFAWQLCKETSEIAKKARRWKKAAMHHRAMARYQRYRFHALKRSTRIGKYHSPKNPNRRAERKKQRKWTESKTDDEQDDQEEQASRKD
jgi:hypothetical protein